MSRLWPGDSPWPPWCRWSLARGPRFRWAARFWSIALVFWVAAWVVGRGWTGQSGHRPAGPAGPGGGGHRRRHRPGRRRLRGGPASRRLRVAPAALGGRRRRLRARRRPHPRLGPARALGPSGQRLQPVGEVDGCQAGRAAPSGSSGWGTAGPSTRARGARGTGWPTPPPRTGAPTPGGCGTRQIRAPPPGWPPPSTWPAPTAPTAWVHAGARRGPLRGVAHLAGPRDRRGAEPAAVSGPGRPGPGPEPPARPQPGGVGHRDHRLRQCRLDSRARRGARGQARGRLAGQTRAPCPSAPTGPQLTPDPRRRFPVLPGPAASRSYRGRGPGGHRAHRAWPRPADGPGRCDGTPAARSPSFGWAGSYPVPRAGSGDAALRRWAGDARFRSWSRCWSGWPRWPSCRSAASRSRSGGSGPAGVEPRGRRGDPDGPPPDGPVGDGSSATPEWCGDRPRRRGATGRGAGRLRDGRSDAGPTGAPDRVGPVRRQWQAVVAVVVVVVGGGARFVGLSRSDRPRCAGSFDAVPVPPPGSSSSSAFCTAGTGNAAIDHHLSDQLDAPRSSAG